MKAAINVRDRAEADRIKRALEDESVRAFVNVVGVLLPLSERARKRVLYFVSDQLDDTPAEGQ